MKTKIIKVPIYGSNLILIEKQDSTAIEIEKKFKLESGVVSNINSFDGVVFDDKFPYDKKKDLGYDATFIIFDTHSAFEMSTIGHEAIHAAKRIFDRVEANFTTEDQEPFCYLVGWILDEAYKFLGVPLKLKDVITPS